MKKWIFLFAFTLSTGLASDVMAQGCSVCTATASNLDSKSARGLNGGILYLAFMPLTIIGFLGYRWYKSNRSLR
jgi:hypothetical protein